MTVLDRIDWFFTYSIGKLLAGLFFLGLAVAAFIIGSHSPDGVGAGLFGALWPTLWAVPFLANWRS